MSLISVAQALDSLRNDVEPMANIEHIALEQSLGRVLAAPQHAAFDMPPMDNSAMDGYALRTQDLDPTGVTSFRLSQRIAAGSQALPLAPGSVARIFTGAPIPSGADAVALQENVRIEGDKVLLHSSLSPGDHIRRRGQDFASGEELVAARVALDPARIGLLAAAGVATVPVFKQIKVALLVTGNELVAPGQPLSAGQIYNSNGYLLSALIRQCGFGLYDAGMVADDLAASKTRLAAAAECADIVISCGGVSVGEEDHVREAVAALGHLSLWRLAIKPGKPLAYGRIGKKPFFGLPGNPVSAFVTFLILVLPYLRHMQGEYWRIPKGEFFKACFDYPQRSERQQYLRVRKVKSNSDAPELELFARQDSSLLGSIAWADALAIVPPGTSVEQGTRLETLTLSSLTCGRFD